MKKYEVNKTPQRNGDHEVHDENGVYLPIIANCNYLGAFCSCESAVAEAKRYYTLSIGCKIGSMICHTR